MGAPADMGVAAGRGDGGTPHGDVLARFAEAATHGSDDLPKIREELVRTVGAAGFVEAAATVGIFNGLVRTADATGIPLDDGMLDASARDRSELGLDAFGSSRNTDLAQASDTPTDDVRKLFDI